MDWRDTVIKITKPIVDEYSYTESYEVGDLDNPITIREKEWDLSGLLEAQAEISFKAGQESMGEPWDREQAVFEDGRKAGYKQRDSEFVYNPDYLNFQKGVKTGRKLGIGEVVEWIEDWNLWGSLSDDILREWQAKLKEWGLE